MTPPSHALTPERVAELLPCPFCGSTELNSKGIGVNCAKCFGRGPWDGTASPTKEQKIAAWNRRESLATQNATLRALLVEIVHRLPNNPILRERIRAALECPPATARDPRECGWRSSEHENQLAPVRQSRESTMQHCR